MDIQELAQELLVKGVELRAQDLYILPKEDFYECYFRKADYFYEKTRLEETLAEKLILHFKFRSGMNIGEKRRAQLGSFSFEISNESLRARLSTVGNFVQRESLVLRFLHRVEDATHRYFFPEQLQEISQMVQKKGLLLFSAPTGNGKTTTMYKIAKMQEDVRQIIAIEDPVEMEDSAILQLQVNEEIAMDYESLIKLCLRHRPDILIIGEIRDERTAKNAIRASLTGHTVISTIHARNIQGVMGRLFDLGVKEQELNECLSGIVYQKIFPDKTGTLSCLFDVWAYTKGGKIDDKWESHLQKLLGEKRISNAIYQQQTMEC